MQDWFWTFYSYLEQSVANFFESLNSVFSPLEWRYITAVADEKQQLHRFMQHWTLKESYIKAIGVGLHMDLQDIEFRISTSDNHIVLFVRGEEQVIRFPWMRMVVPRADTKTG